MAYQRYRAKGDRTVGENEASPTRATHPARPELPVKSGRENKTPAPIASPTTTSDQARATSWGRSGGDRGDNPGKQGYGGPSSLNPGERAGEATINPGAATDTVLDGLIRGGVRALDQGDNWQTRQLDGEGKEGRVPTHPCMKPANVGGAPYGEIPATLAPKDALGKDAFAPRRNAALKR